MKLEFRPENTPAVQITGYGFVLRTKMYQLAAMDKGIFLKFD